jgi:hypothetical protein
LFDLFSQCVEQYYQILFRVCECTEELKQELRHVKSERDQMSEDLINAENAFTDIKKRNEKLKLIINEHKTVRLKRGGQKSWIFPHYKMKVLDEYRTALVASILWIKIFKRESVRRSLYLSYRPSDKEIFLSQMKGLVKP